MKRLVGLCAAAALALCAGASAITNGAPDGDGHPAVGALLAQQAFSDGTWEECTGTLIAPRVFLTAEHCDEGVSRVNVTFATDYMHGVSKEYAGTWIGDPSYRKANSDPHDLAIVLLDDAITDITPAALPAPDSLDNLPSDQRFTSVGYGAQSVSSGPGGKTFHYQDIRYVATGGLNATTPSWLRISQNPAKGDGGTCYGDSGGPNFLGAGDGETNIIAATTISGDTPCRATNVDYRLDTPSARAFLGQFPQYLQLP
jgi:secreted trypsin-like serine protease